MNSRTVASVRDEMQAARTLLEALGTNRSPVSVWTGQAEAWVREWAVAFGLTRSKAARDRFRKTAAGALAGRVYSTAIDQDRLQTATAWIGWLFLIDDQLDEGETGRELQLVRDRLRPFIAMAGEMTGRTAVRLEDGARSVSPAREPSSCLPLVSALRDIWYRLAGRMTEHWRAVFARHYLGYLSGCEWEAANRGHGRIPPIHEFVPNRRHAGAIWPSLDLLEYVADAPLPDDVRSHPLLLEARTACADVVCWSDDLLTVAKERAHGDVHNLVIVLEHQTGCDEPTALQKVVERIASRIADFDASRQRISATDLGGHSRDAVDRYIQGLHHWMRGHLDWGLQTIRYDADATLGGPYLEDLLSASE